MIMRMPYPVDCAGGREGECAAMSMRGSHKHQAHIPFLLKIQFNKKWLSIDFIRLDKMTFLRLNEKNYKKLSTNNEERVE